MELPDADSVASTELQCDIQPGALRQRYSVQWNQILQNGSFVLVDKDMFNLTLNVSSSLNGSQYQCEVTIIHDGLTIRTYTTGRIVILVSCKNNDHCMSIDRAGQRSYVKLLRGRREEPGHGNEATKAGPSRRAYYELTTDVHIL